jgi:hypothetical protein
MTFDMLLVVRQLKGAKYCGQVSIQCIIRLEKPMSYKEDYIKRYEAARAEMQEILKFAQDNPPSTNLGG